MPISLLTDINKIMYRTAVIFLMVIGNASAQDELRYLVNYTHAPPTIDGLKTSDEWRDAAPSLDPWVLLGSVENKSLDETHNRFEALWDDTGIYLKHEVKYGEWDERGSTLLDANYETLEFYFDPNVDGETNAQNGPNDTGTDGYMLAFNQPLMQSQISRDGINAAYYAEAHVNSEFGSQGGIWSNFSNIEMRQITSIEEQFGYTELFIPWSDFNATNPLFGFNELFGDDIGLYHPEAPDGGEEWFFNIGRVETGGRRPAWTVSSPSASFLATRPHGILEFHRSPGEMMLCDVNRDGACTAQDIDEITDAIFGAVNDGRYDLNQDGLITVEDRMMWIEDPNFMHTYLGDSNLDKQFSTTDFVVVFQAAEYEDEIPLNSGWAEGDWNGDKEFNTRDFVDAFQTASYEKGPRQLVAAVVPEPASSTSALVAGFLLFRLRSRRK